MLLNNSIEKILIVGIIITCAIFCTCKQKAAKTVTDDDNGSKIEINIGKVLAVKLKAQLSTGFAWELVAGDKLELLGKPRQSSNVKQITGGIEYQTFQFKAAEKGETDLKLEYKKSFEKDTKPDREFAITVVIK